MYRNSTGQYWHVNYLFKFCNKIVSNETFSGPLPHQATPHLNLIYCLTHCGLYMYCDLFTNNFNVVFICTVNFFCVYFFHCGLFPLLSLSWRIHSTAGKYGIHKTIKFCWDEVINMRNLGRHLHFHYTFIKDVYSQIIQMRPP